MRRGGGAGGGGRERCGEIWPDLNGLTVDYRPRSARPVLLLDRGERGREWEGEG